MRGLFSALLSYLVMFVTAQNPLQFLGQGIQKELVTIKQPIVEGIVQVGSVSSVAVTTVGEGVQKEIQTVKQPIDVSIAYVGSSQCHHVKKLVGVSYEQLQGEREPNLNTLTLVYRTEYFSTVMNISHAPESLRQARLFDGDRKLIVFIHGFTDDPNKESFNTIFRAFRDSGRVSLIALDCSSLIRWFYLRSSTYVRFIGQKLAQVLAAAVQHGQNPSLIHLIGHSLGAHISGFTGKTFEELTGIKIGHISGLDPAGPCFTHVDDDLRLKRTDAEFVAAIHTDAGVYGLKDPVGHKDYYPNSGSMQPNCLFQTCSHSRVWQLLSESVLNQTAFPAVRCRDWDAFKKGECEEEISYMGYADTPGPEGLFYLQTASSPPYGLGLAGTKYTNTDGILQTIGGFLG